MEFVFEPWHWFVFGVVLMISELILPAFAALWFGIAAILVGVLLWIFPSMGLTSQLVTWCILAVLCTVAWFKFIKPLSVDKTKAGLPREATIGQTGMVIQINLDHEHVIVRFPMPVLGSDEWSCRSLSNVQVGDRVRVVDISGNDLVIKLHQSTKDNQESE